MTTQKFISMHELHERLLTEPVSISSEDIIVDVRTPEEFKDGHIAGALNRPLDQIQQSPETFKNEFQKYRDVYVHCQAGRRSQMACQILDQVGSKNWICISVGGMGDWIMARYPFERN
jgi:rhodanese-related sulfurtransferase